VTVKRYQLWPHDGPPIYVNRCDVCIKDLISLKWIKFIAEVKNPDPDSVCEDYTHKDVVVGDEEWFYARETVIPALISRDAWIPRSVLIDTVGGQAIACAATVKHKKTPANPRSKKSMRRAMKKAAAVIRRLDNRFLGGMCWCHIMRSDAIEKTCTRCLLNKLVDWADKYAPNRKVEK